jgi:eukaryotic-like serine/threonine-protein kinase
MVSGQLDPAQRARVADHAAGCRSCHQLVEILVTQHGRPQEHPTGTWTVGAVVGGRFRIEEILGAGGMGVVVVATHLELGNRVAIKFLRDELLRFPDLVERFIREARAAARLRTEHICRVLDVNRLESGAPYIVMEVLEGTDLARIIAQRPVPAALAVHYVLQACVALAEAHAAGIVHRDLKPANLFITHRLDGSELVKVLDFGIAKAISDEASLTHTKVTMGSPGYMSPEQLESARDVDARTDLWALGVTLYQLISGRLPFWAPSATEVAIKITSEPPAPIELDPGLRGVVLRCLEKSPSRRYANVAELALALAPFGGPHARDLVVTIARLGHQPLPATFAETRAAATAEPAHERPARRRRWPIAAAAIVALGGAGAFLAVAASRDGASAPGPSPPSGAATETATVAPSPTATTSPPATATTSRSPATATTSTSPPATTDPIEAAMGALPGYNSPAAVEQMKKSMIDGCRLAQEQHMDLPPGGLVNCACITGDAALARRTFPLIKDPQSAAIVRSICAHYHIAVGSS